MTIPGSRALCALLGCALLVCADTARAQDADADGDSASTSRSIALPPIDLGGFVQIDERRAFNGGYRQEFSVRRARVSLAGQAVRRVRYRVEFHVQTARDPLLLAAYADVDLGRGFRIRAGQNRYEFDIEGSESEELLPVIDRSWASNIIASELSGGAWQPSNPDAFHDRGLTVFSRAPTGGLEWSLIAGIYEGAGAGYDRDDELAFVARGTVQYATVILSYGWMNNRVNPFYKYQAWTAGLDHMWRWNHLRAEVYEGQGQGSNGDVEIQGVYALDVVRVHPAIDLAARWQQMRFPDYQLRDASGVDASARFHFLRGNQRSNTWLALGWMVRNAEFGMVNTLGNLNDGVLPSSLSADRWRHLVIARFQVAY